MREGPLAALFRKTDEDAARAPRARRAAAGEPRSREAASATSRRRARAPRAVPHPAPARRSRDASRAREEPRDVPDAAGAPAPRVLRGHPRERHGRAAEPARRTPDARPVRALRGRARRASAGSPVLRVVGVGGAGVNAVNRMVEAEVEGVEFIAINTDLQSLQQSTADITLHIGPSITRGLGSGSNPDLGRAAAMEEYDKIKALLKGSDMIFITAGAGGGTGTGAAPIVARIAREIGALTVGDRHEAVRLRGHAPRARRPTSASRRWPTRSTR